MHRLLELFHVSLLTIAALFYRFTPKGRRWFELQRHPSAPSRLDFPLTWVHASSLGETEMAVTFIRTLLASGAVQPQQILLTFTSPSAAAKAAKYRIELGIGAMPLPLTFFHRYWNHLNVWNIRRLILIKYDLYPWIRHLIERRQIETHVLSYAFTKRSSLARHFPLFRSISCVNTQSREEVLRICPSASVTVDGDLRAESAVSRKVLGAPVAGTIVLGSVWPKDWALLRQALRNVPWTNLIVVPHEPTETFVRGIHNDSLLHFPHTQVLMCTPSRADLFDAPHGQVFVVTEMGVLMRLYGMAEKAFVGGGFEKRVHNVYEPIVYGIPTITGPRVSNAPEVYALSESGGLKIAHDVASLTEALSSGSKPELPQEKFALASHNVVNRLLIHT